MWTGHSNSGKVNRHGVVGGATLDTTKTGDEVLSKADTGAIAITALGKSTSWNLNILLSAYCDDL